jgi:hypothetical protein
MGFFKNLQIEIWQAIDAGATDDELEALLMSSGDPTSDLLGEDQEFPAPSQERPVHRGPYPGADHEQ